MTRIGAYTIIRERVVSRLEEMGQSIQYLKDEADRRNSEKGARGCSARTVGYALSGRAVFMNTVTVMAEILGVNHLWLMGKSEDPTPIPAAIPPVKKTVTGKLPGKLEDYTPEQLKALLERIIQASGKDGDGEITRLGDGSVIFELELDADVADAVLAAFAAGKLAELGVAELREATPVEIAEMAAGAAGDLRAVLRATTTEVKSDTTMILSTTDNNRSDDDDPNDVTVNNWPDDYGPDPNIVSDDEIDLGGLSKGAGETFSSLRADVGTASICGRRNTSREQFEKDHAVGDLIYGIITDVNDEHGLIIRLAKDVYGIADLDRLSISISPSDIFVIGQLIKVQVAGVRPMIDNHLPRFFDLSVIYQSVTR